MMTFLTVLYFSIGFIAALIAVVLLCTIAGVMFDREAVFNALDEVAKRDGEPTETIRKAKELIVKVSDKTSQSKFYFFTRLALAVVIALFAWPIAIGAAIMMK